MKRIRRRISTVIGAVLVVVASAASVGTTHRADSAVTIRARGERDSIFRVASRLCEGAGPAVSADGRWLAFTRNDNSLWLMDLRTRQVQLIGPTGVVRNPTWNPSGSQIAYSGDGGQPGNLGIWIVGRDGTHLRKLPDSQGGYPLWSPDGKWIVWTRGSLLWVADSNGAAMHSLTRTPAKTFEFALSWYHDGRSLLYAASDRLDSYYQLRLIESDGSNQRTDSSQVETVFPQGTRLSPDGSRIYRSLWGTTPGLGIFEHKTGRKLLTVLVTKGSSDVGNMAFPQDESFVVYDNADPEGNEVLSLVKIK